MTDNVQNKKRSSNKAWLINGFIAILPACIYLINGLYTISAYGPSVSIYLPSGALLVLYLIALAAYAVTILVNYYLNAKTGLKIVKTILFVLLAGFAVNFIRLLLILKENYELDDNQYSSFKLSIAFMIILSIAAFVFNLLVRGSRFTNLTFLISSTVSLLIILITNLTGGVFFNPVMFKIFIVIILLSLAVPVISIISYALSRPKQKRRKRLNANRVKVNAAFINTVLDYADSLRADLKGIAEKPELDKLDDWMETLKDDKGELYYCSELIETDGISLERQKHDTRILEEKYEKERHEADFVTDVIFDTTKSSRDKMFASRKKENELVRELDKVNANLSKIKAQTEQDLKDFISFANELEDKYSAPHK